ncbi:TetR-like C-terminal domain-containing protein [Amycolatopsis sp. NPDC051716]|uniref:TetR-like C-terminal domain-containing protein n=1 Tax=Amycolatopsis sp. NPDC051716 TaxID=3155804 RepID=UPI0034438C53
MLHGFATLEAASGFRIDADVEDSFTWLVDFVDRGRVPVTRRARGTPFSRPDRRPRSR